ncbi:MAG: ABC transporter substrate-binding protein [Succinivibrio sp.]|nr:ABC transporter substrate-binding protein [Succinivibrio sp.]
MRALIKSLVMLAALVWGFNSAQAAETKNPYELANEVASNTLSDLQAHREQLSDLNFTLGIIQKDLLPYMDAEYAAYKVIGTQLKKTTKEERAEFTAAFREYMLRTLAETLSKYTTQELVPSPVKSVGESENIVSVKMGIHESGKQDLFAVLKMRKNSKTGEWKAYDLIAENISVLDAKQSELSPIISEQGIAAATKLLRDKIAGK